MANKHSICRSPDTLSDQELENMIEQILRAGGSSLRHYTMQKTHDDLKSAMRRVLSDFVEHGSRNTPSVQTAQTAPEAATTNQAKDGNVLVKTPRKTKLGATEAMILEEVRSKGGTSDSISDHGPGTNRAITKLEEKGWLVNVGDSWKVSDTAPQPGQF